jgi:Spy/CpxP family protein refolding chaperone
MKTLRFYKILVVVLILINAVTLYFMFTAHRPHGRPGKTQLVDNLGITGANREKIIQLQEDHFIRKDQLINKGRDLHEKLFRSFNDPSKDTAEVAAIIDDIVENQRETEQMTFDHFKDVNALCDPQQQKELQKLLQELLRRAGGPPPPKK